MKIDRFELRSAKFLSRSKFLSKWVAPLGILAAALLALAYPGPENRSGVDGVATASAAPVPASETTPDTGVGRPVSTASSEPVASADMLGLSGKLRAVMGTSDALVQNPLLKPLLAEGSEGAWPRLLTPGGDSFTVVTLVPMAEARSADYARYHVGSWPSDGISGTVARYAPPSGFIGVTQRNQDTKVSSNFEMRDFLTHDQGNVWPKVLVLRPTILDKLELLRVELEREGLPSRLHVMSGFRTPQYNALGVGEGGRAGHSRHMYGDAADVFVDANQDGMMDDLNRDGKITVADARVLRAAAERVEEQYPALVGGLAAYPANSAHGPFVHVDARGVKARWGS